jgi:hypothetical protein
MHTVPERSKRGEVHSTLMLSEVLPRERRDLGSYLIADDDPAQQGRSRERTDGFGPLIPCDRSKGHPDRRDREKIARAGRRSENSMQGLYRGAGLC